MPVAHKQGADRSGSGDPGPPRVFGFFLRVEKETAPPRAVAAKRKLDEIIIKCVTGKAERKERTNSLSHAAKRRASSL